MNNYIQIVEQTDEEKLKMYMKCKKIELAKMLIEANRVRKLTVDYSMLTDSTITTNADGVEYPYTRNYANSKTIGYICHKK